SLSRTGRQREDFAAMISFAPRTIDACDAQGQRLVLRALGTAPPEGAPAIGVCGSRSVSERGLEIAEEVGRTSAQMGVALIAGDARGVDETAEAAVIRFGGQAVAVLAEGLRHWR